MTDAMIMVNTLETQEPRDFLFKDVQIKTLADNNKQNYSAGQINFDTKSMSSLEYWVPGEEATELLIPFTATVTGVLSANNCLGTVLSSDTTGGSGVPPASVVDGEAINGAASNVGGILVAGSVGSIAPKLSILDLIKGVEISLQSGGAGIVNDSKSLSMINNIRLLLQHSDDWETVNAAQFCFAKNTAATLPNTGFETRQKYLYSLSNCTYYYAPNGATGSTSYISKIESVISIPLKYLHSFFANLDFLQRGIDYNINFSLGREFNPNTSEYSFDVVPNGSNAIPTITWTLGQASVAETNWTGCMIKYRGIQVDPVFGKKLNDGMLSGKLAVRERTFAACQPFDDQTAKSGDLTSYQIATGIIRPIRMFIIGMAAGTLRSQKLPFVTNLLLKSLNVRINGENRFANGLNNPYDLYSQVEEQMPELNNSPVKGSLLTFQDFYSVSPFQFSVEEDGLEPAALYALYCIDLQHQQGRTRDEAVQLVLDSVKTSSTTSASSDYLILVETEKVAHIIQSKNAVEIKVGAK